MICYQGMVKDRIHTAWFSMDGLYRYRLDIRIGQGRVLGVCGLNPSKAGATRSDNTAERLISWAITHDFGQVRIFNAFALVATDRSELRKHSNPIGPENSLHYLQSNADECDDFVLAFGTEITKKPWAHYYRGHDIAAAIPSAKCFRLTKNGHPEHPLYLPKGVALHPFAYIYEICS